MQLNRIIASLWLVTILISNLLVTSMKAEGLNQAGIPSSYTEIYQNNQLALYLQRENLAIKVKDLHTGYVWSSVIDEVNPKENNIAWSHFMGSGLSFEYFEKEKPNPSRTDFISQTNKQVNIQKIDRGFQAEIYFNDLKLGLKLEVEIENNQLVVHIPNISIKEDGDYKLASVFVYPFLGATHKGEIPGYMFIPDGSGALIKLQDNQNRFKQPYEAKIYGPNEGIEPVTRDIWTKPPNYPSLPVFGIVHRINSNGLFGIVEKGKYNAKIVAYPNGVNTQYNWITPQYLFREAYLQPTSRTMGGIIVHEKDKNNEDLQTRYFFLTAKMANYIGMAKTYQNYLVEQGILKKKNISFEQIPIRLDILGAETENGLFFKKIVPMTSTDQLLSIIEDLKKNKIQNMLLVLKGWNKGGLSGASPIRISFEKSLEDKKKFSTLINQLKNPIQLYFYDDYTIAYDESKRFSAKSDSAKKIDKTIIEIMSKKPVYEKYYFMSTKKSGQIVSKNQKSYKEKMISQIALDHTGSILFSELADGKVHFRWDAAKTYIKMIETLRKSLQSVIMYKPNDYMLKYSDYYLDIPMDSSLYMYESETIPFIQIVLKGYMDYFAPYSNFSANQQKDLLRLIEYGAYPSYYLTYESSYKLKNTNSNDLYTSAYKDWKEDILDKYEQINNVLKRVNGATIEDRQILKNDVVKVGYSNGVEIIVNYSDTNFNYQDITVPAKGVKVIEVKSK